MEMLNLDSIVQKEMTVNLKGESYVIPAQPPMDFVLQLQSIQQKAMKEKNENKQIQYSAEVCAVILNQDQSKKTTVDYVMKNVSFAQMQMLVKFYQEQISKIEQDPN